MIDLIKIRQETPHCDEVIHFNNAGASLSPKCVTDAQISHLLLEQKIGGYEAADKASLHQERFYSAFAELLNCQASEIAFLENATKAWHAAFHAIDLKPGDHIITADVEYASNYLDLLHSSRYKDLQLSTVARNEHGQVDVDSLRNEIKPNTKLICLTHIPSQRGDIQPAIEIGALAKEHELWFLLDACQSAGQLRLDVNELNCDFLCGTGRKYLRGPRGTGFLYVRQSRLQELVPAVVDLHSVQWQSPQEYALQENAKRFENWERNVAALIGLGVAVDYALDIGIDNIEKRVSHLARTLHDELQKMSNVVVQERSIELSGITTFSRTDQDADSTRQQLMQAGINTSISRQSNAQLDLGKQQLDVNRASIHYYNTEEEIERFIDVLRN